MPKITKIKKKRSDFASLMKTPLNFFSRVVDSTYVVEVDVPGMTATDVNITIYIDFVSIAGKRMGVPWNTAIPIDNKIYDPETCSAFFKDCILQLSFEVWDDTVPTVVVVKTEQDPEV